MTRRHAIAWLVAILLSVVSPMVSWFPVSVVTTHAQTPASAPKKERPAADRDINFDAESEGESPLASLHWESVLNAAIALPVATILGAALALRPRRRGTPKRSLPIVQTQIILAVIGALVMLVVGSSLARAFGVVGAAGLVRYRARVQDPKDAGVMLSTLAIGLSSGVGMYLLAVFAAVFIMIVLWVIESFEPEAHKVFVLKVTITKGAEIEPSLEKLLRRQQAGLELRTSAADELCYEVRLPIDRRTDDLTKSILALSGATAVEWTEQKKKQSDES